MENYLKDIGKKKQSMNIEFTCSYYAKRKCIKEKEFITIHEIFGQLEVLEELSTFIKKLDNNFFPKNRCENLKMIEHLVKKIETKTNHPLFDEYSKQCYLDNLLRGGEPIQLTKNKIFYLFSRKHGDM